MVECNLPKVDAAGSSPVVRLFSFHCFLPLTRICTQNKFATSAVYVFDLLRKSPALRLSTARSSPRLPLRVPSSACFLFIVFCLSHASVRKTSLLHLRFTCSVCSANRQHSGSLRLVPRLDCRCESRRPLVFFSLFFASHSHLYAKQVFNI